LRKKSFEWKNFKWLVVLTIIEILSGAIMRLEVPKSAQLLHAILSLTLF
jgi:hypothetical protein